MLPISSLGSEEEIRQVYEPRDAAEEEVGEGGQRRRGYNGTHPTGAAGPVLCQVWVDPESKWLFRQKCLPRSRVADPHPFLGGLNAHVSTWRVSGSGA